MKSKVTSKANYLFNCDSSNVVYLLECNVCGVQYVGSTNMPFRLRTRPLLRLIEGLKKCLDKKMWLVQCLWVYQKHLIVSTSHILLLAKLESYGFSDNAMEFI